MVEDDDRSFPAAVEEESPLRGREYEPLEDPVLPGYSSNTPWTLFQRGAKYVLLLSVVCLTLGLTGTAVFLARNAKADVSQRILLQTSNSWWSRGYDHPFAWSSQIWDDLYKSFYLRYHRHELYAIGSEEYQRRFQTFKANILKIYDHNHHIRYIDHENVEVKLAPTQFTDMTFYEFQSRYLTNLMDAGALPITSSLRINNKVAAFAGKILANVRNDSLPSNVNWVTKGCVTNVKNQAKCGSCWAFSATGAIEGAVCAQTGKLISLSEQQLVDCGAKEGLQGCNGGFMDNAFQYVVDNGGLCTESDYPYTGVEGQCRAKKCSVASIISGVLDLPHNNAKAVRAAVAFYGPVSVGVRADKPAFQFYHTGIFNMKCGKRLNHAVLIVGYGEENGQGYWLVKNSWGDAWGDHGYIKISTDPHPSGAGECGILLAPSVPLIEKGDAPLQ